MAETELSQRVAAVIAALRPGEPVVDASLEPERAASVLTSTERAWLRVLPELGAASGDGYGPAPRDPAWVRVCRGSAKVEVLAHGSSTVEAAPSTASVASVTLEASRLTWGTSAAPIVKHLARGLVALEPGGPALVCSAIADDASRARADVLAVLSPLASSLGLDVAGADEQGPEPGESAAPPAPDAAVPSSSDVGRELVRFTLGWEGDRRVLRDLAHPGPRASGWIWTTIALLSGAGAVATLVSLAASLRAGAPWMKSAANGGVAVVFALGAFAFFHVARHALRYRAAGTPIAVFADDRVVVMPWVRRDGAIDPRPEGRFGAGVRVAEIRRVHVLERDGAATVSLDTEHGPIDVAGGVGTAAIEALRRAIERSTTSVGAPRRKTAIMRARERTQRGPEGSSVTAES